MSPPQKKSELNKSMCTCMLAIFMHVAQMYSDSYLI